MASPKPLAMFKQRVLTPFLLFSALYSRLLEQFEGVVRVTGEASQSNRSVLNQGLGVDRTPRGRVLSKFGFVQNRQEPFIARDGSVQILMVSKTGGPK